MSGKRKKFHYIISGGKMPRRTEYRLRKALEAKEAAQLLHQAVGEDSETTDDESQNLRPKFTCTDENSTSIETESHQDEQIRQEDLSNSSASSDDISNMTPVSTQSQQGDCVLTCSETTDENSDLVDTEGHQSSDGQDFMGEGRAQIEIISDLGEVANLDEVLNMNERPNVTLNNEEIQAPVLGNKLCPCSSSTEGDALLYCLALGIRHNLSWVAMVDILKMINALYGYEVVSASKYHLHKLFDKQKTAKYHLYCALCETYLGVKGDMEEERKCECSGDGENVQPSESFFVSVDLAEEFKSVMQNNELANEILTYRFQRKKLEEDAYEDIFDGEAYKNLCKDGEILGHPYNFSYTFNTDGVQMGKSTRNAAWPIFISINELSPQNRKKHMIFAGVWVGKTQPNMRIFLKPFIEEANKLSQEGFYWTDSENFQRHSRVIPLCCVLDSAARYKLLNMTSYTGYFGCTFCYQRAEHTKKGRRFTIPNSATPLRTHQSMLEDMKEAFKERNNPDKKKRIVKGCKGYTPLVLMKYLSLDTSFVVDSMHNSFLGVAKSHTSNLLTQYGTKFYIGSPDQISVLCSRLCAICPPSFITRPPRSVEEWKMWKASEWRSWLLFYVLVCLHGLIPSVYIHHLALFSTALHLLLQKSVTYADIQLANQYLRKYVFLTQKYFGKTAMLYNTHLLLHLCRSAANYGPLWTHTAFQFEGENHHFMQMRTSPGHVAQQLVKRYSIFTAFPILCETYASSEKPLEFLNEITEKSLKSFTRQDNYVLKSKGISLPFNSVEKYVRPLVTEHQNADVLSFQKMFYGGVRYCTSSYAKGKKHDDSFISLGPNLKARIENIIQIKLDDHEAILMLLIIPFTVKIPQFLKTNLVSVVHVKEIVKTGDIVAIKPTNILGHCVHIEMDGRRFLADIPYGCYGD